MSETSDVPSTSAGVTQQSGTTGLNDGSGDERDRELVYGGTGVPADASSSVDADHPGMPAGGDLGDESVTSSSLAEDPQIRAEESES